MMGPVPSASSDHTPAGSNNGGNLGNAMDIDGGAPSHWQEQLAPPDAKVIVGQETVT